MKIEKILDRLRNVENPLKTEINGIRFRGEEQGRFRFKYNNYQTYAGDYLINNTPASLYLNNAIFYANERASQRRYIEKDGHLDILQILGFPLVMAIDISKYKTKAGIEPNEEVIIGEIDKKDIFVLFNDEVDYLKELINESWYSTLEYSVKRAQNIKTIVSV